MRQWLIDAFAEAPFLGNPACVLEPLEAWPNEGWMQTLASENNAGATAFLVRSQDASTFDLRWFTAAVEVPLCGHATLAAGHLLLHELGLSAPRLKFRTASGPLGLRRCGEAYEMEFPVPPFRPLPTPAGLADALDAEPSRVWAGPYLVALFDRAEDITRLQPDLPALRRISLAAGGQGNVGVAAPAPAGVPWDVVDRFFAPGYGIDEDRATGSFHALLTAILAHDRMGGPIRFRQAFPGRRADLVGELAGARVRLRGEAVTISEQHLRIAPP